MKRLTEYISENKVLHQNVNIAESKALHQKDFAGKIISILSMTKLFLYL